MNEHYITWNEKEQKAYMANWLRGLLKTNVVNISFVKKDGSTRMMNATLMPEKLASSKEEGTSKESNDYIRVTDIELNEWRTIRVDSITEIKFTLE